MDFEAKILNLQRDTVEEILMLVNELCAPDRRQEILADFVSNAWLPNKSDANLNRIRSGWLSEFEFVLLLGKYANDRNKSINNDSQIVSKVLSRLKKCGIIVDLGILGRTEFRVSDGLMAYFSAIGLAENIVFGLNHMIERAKRSVPAVNVQIPNGDIHCGSGIATKCGDKPDTGFFILTNKHVVEGNLVREVKTPEQLFTVTGQPTLCEWADLAAIPVTWSIPIPITPILDETEVLMPVIALGYPRVPTASAQFAMAHRGEVNGTLTTLYGNEFLAISCHVSPGNSGGPILTEMGFCVGIVTQSGTGEFGSVNDPAGTYRSTYHMAIPPQQVLKFLSELDDQL
jgi:Trypsin-like peptidase domain